MLILLSDRLSEARCASIVVDLDKMYSSWIMHKPVTERSLSRLSVPEHSQSLPTAVTLMCRHAVDEQRALMLLTRLRKGLCKIEQGNLAFNLRYLLIKALEL